MKFNKIVAGVLMVSVVCCLMIAYTGSSSGTPPTEEELLAQSYGLVVTSNRKTVYPDEEGMWRYRLYISPEADGGVLLQTLEIKCYTFRKEYVLDKTYDSSDFKNWWGSPYVPAGETRDFGAGLPSRNNIYYRDHIFIGIDDTGNEVKGTIRIHFSKEKQTTETSVQGPPTEEEFLAQSHGLVVTSDKQTVYPDSENAWRYRLSISPEGDSGVLVQKLDMKCYTFGKEYVLDETFDGNNFKDWWGSPYIQAGQTKNFGAGLSSRSNIYYRDHTFTGIDDMGNEVKGTIRVHFSKEEAPPSEEETEGSLPEGVPTEEEFLAQSHGLVITSTRHTVYWDEKEGWKWTLKITPDKGLNVTLQGIEIRYVSGSRMGEEASLDEDFIKRVWHTSRLLAGEVREFTAGMGPSSRPPDFNDYIFTGIDDNGNEVKGTIRVHFSKEEAPPSEQETERSLPEGVLTEEEFLAQSHGLVITSDQHTVRWDKRDGWIYTLRITPEKGINVTLQEIKIRHVSGSRMGEEVYGKDFIERVWRTCRIPAGEVRKFTAGMGPSSTPPDFRDYIFTGIDDDGNKVRGTIRIYFAESEE